MAGNPPPDIQAFIQAIIDAVIANRAASAAAAAAMPVPVPAVPFALVPGRAFIGPLDYTKAVERMMFLDATSAMENKYDLTERRLHLFLQTIKDHVLIYNWENFITVPDATGVGRNLVTNYSKVSEELVRAHAITYINTPTREAQNSMMLYQYIHHSLTDEALSIMLTMKDQYHEGGVPSGALFLKAIIGRAY